MTGVKTIIWDVDKVWYPDISTNYASRGSNEDPKPFMEQAIEDGWYTPGIIDKYLTTEKKQNIETISDMANMYTYFFKVLRQEGTEQPYFSKEQTIERKQGLLGGLTMQKLREIADSVEFTPYLREAVDLFRQHGIKQAAYSDGLGPFVYYITKKFGMDYACVTPAIVKRNGQEVVFDPEWTNEDGIILTGKTQKGYDKTKLYHQFVENNNSNLSSTAAIDDSASNIDGMLLPIHKAGGLAVGFCPTPQDRPKFDEAGIYVITERNLKPFADMVLERI